MRGATYYILRECALAHANEQLQKLGERLDSGRPALAVCSSAAQPRLKPPLVAASRIRIPRTTSKIATAELFSFLLRVPPFPAGLVHAWSMANSLTSPTL